MLLEKIVENVKKRENDCYLTGHLAKILLQDIHLQSKHYRTWFSALLYLSNQIARSTEATSGNLAQ